MSAWLPESPLALAAAIGITMGLMYLGRPAAHGALEALGSAVRRACGLASGLLRSAHERLAARNREVLLEMGREATERSIEREFHRVSQTVTRDLSGYPALHRKLDDQITRMNEDYREATEVPPTPPEWTGAVEAIAKIPSNGDPVVGKILKDLSKTLDKAYREATDSYRRASAERHRILRRMLPFWRRTDQTLDRVHGTIIGLEERSQTLDRQMQTYEQIRTDSDDAVRTLSASSMSHFVSSGLVLFIALMGGFINFHLIALPMSEMVGATSHVGSIMTSDIAALVIITTEVAMGLFLMECLRITRLFPVIHRMDDVVRGRMLWISLIILTTLAGVEASLAYMRDLLAADREALTLTLSGMEAVAGNERLRWIPSVGQMVMGFMLPFALAFAAIPLESFIASSRIVFGSLFEGTLRLSAAVVDLIGSLAEGVAPILVHVYDLMIVIPLRIEQLITRERFPSAGSAKSHSIELPRTM